MRESYNTPEGVYRRAKARGMDLVTITDHDEIDGALTIADRPDVIVGCEVTGVFPDDGVRVHLNVLGITEPSIARSSGCAHDVARTAAVSAAASALHVAQPRGVAHQRPDHGAAHRRADAVGRRPRNRNGSRLPTQNRTAQCLAERAARSASRGSDSHTAPRHRPHLDRGAGATHPRRVHGGLRAGRVARRRPAGHYFTMASDMLRFAGASTRSRLRVAVPQRRWLAAPALVLGGVLGLPLVACRWRALSHFVLEDRFNRELLFDLVRGRAACGGAGARRDACMRVAIFTDNDFDKVNGVTTTLTARAGGHARRISARAIYTAARRGIDDRRLSGAALVRRRHSVLPRDEDVCAALSRHSSSRARAIGIDVVHLHDARSGGPGGDVRRRRLGCRWWAASIPTWRNTPSC